MGGLINNGDGPAVKKAIRTLSVLNRGRRDRGVLDLDDLILGSMGSSLNSMLEMSKGFQSIDSVFEVAPGIEISFPVPTRDFPSWMSRLKRLIKETVAFVNSLDVDISLTTTVMGVLKADGWVVNRKTIKTPSWMVPHRELNVSYLHLQLSLFGVPIEESAPTGRRLGFDPTG